MDLNKYQEESMPTDNIRYLLHCLGLESGKFNAYDFCVMTFDLKLRHFLK